jgi:chorismate synthase
MPTLSYRTAGESHGKALIALVEGLSTMNSNADRADMAAGDGRKSKPIMRNF